MTIFNPTQPKHDPWFDPPPPLPRDLKTTNQRLAEMFSLARSGPEWKSFKEKSQSVVAELSDIMSHRRPNRGGSYSDTSSSSGQSSPGSAAGTYGDAAAAAAAASGESGGSAGLGLGLEGGRVTGERLPEKWEERFDLFLDSVRTRWGPRVVAKL